MVSRLGLASSVDKHRARGRVGERRFGIFSVRTHQEAPLVCAPLGSLALGLVIIYFVGCYRLADVAGCRRGFIERPDQLEILTTASNSYVPKDSAGHNTE